MIKQSKQKSQLLQGYGDAIIRADKLEEDLQNQKAHAVKLQIKLDGNAAEYRNEIQKLTGQKDKLIGKNKVLLREKKGNILTQ